MAHDVFISHSSHDKATADAACAVLEANGIRCWIAPRDILPGSKWGEAIIDAINASRAMVLVFSSKSNYSAQIYREVERAVNKGVMVIPLRIEDVMPSKSLEYFISDQHWLDALTPPLEKHLKRLADTLKVFLSKTAEDRGSGESIKEIVQDKRDNDEVDSPEKDRTAAKPKQEKPLIGIIVSIIAGAILLIFNIKFIVSTIIYGFEQDGLTAISLFPFVKIWTYVGHVIGIVTNVTILAGAILSNATYRVGNKIIKLVCWFQIGYASIASVAALIMVTMSPNWGKLPDKVKATFFLGMGWALIVIVVIYGLILLLFRKYK